MGKRNATILMAAFLLLWLVMSIRTVLAGVPDQAATLATLKPLPKTLLSWAPAKFASDAELEQWVRVSGSFPASWWTSEVDLRKGAGFLARHGGILHFNYSSLKSQYRAVETRYEGDPDRISLEKQMVSMDLGLKWMMERGAVFNRLTMIAGICRNNDIDPDRVLLFLDHENAVLNDMTVPAICHKMNELYDYAHGLGFKCWHYNYRGIRFDPRGKFEPWWGVWKMAPKCCKSDFASTSLYRPNEPHHMRQKMQKTLKNTTLDVVPWVSLGWRWRRTYSSATGLEGKVPSLVYDVEYSSIMGDDLNREWKSNIPTFFYDNKRIPIVAVWPGPGHADSFWPHFYAYHRGAVRNSKAPRMEVMP